MRGGRKSGSMNAKEDETQKKSSRKRFGLFGKKKAGTSPSHAPVASAQARAQSQAQGTRRTTASSNNTHTTRKGRESPASAISDQDNSYNHTVAVSRSEETPNLSTDAGGDAGGDTEGNFNCQKQHAKHSRSGSRPSSTGIINNNINRDRDNIVQTSIATTGTNSNRRKSDKTSKLRAVVSRKFGRSWLPNRKGRTWVVEVSPAEWDADQSRWKYRILVQKRQLQHTADIQQTPTSFTTAFTWRSLADFVWLEQALRAEYHGALLLPLLSIAIGTPDLANTNYEVDAALLRDWLSDVLNGVRGHGEIVIDQKSVDLISSEAMEAFLYRNTDPLPIVSSTNYLTNQSMLPSKSTLDLPWKDSPEKETRDASFVDSLWSKPFHCIPLDNLCLGSDPTANDGTTTTTTTSPSMRRIPVEIMRANCSSRALGDSASLQIQDSFAQNEVVDSSPLAIHSELIEAENELIQSHRAACMSTMERLQALKDEESKVASAWKRFAISLSNLYSYEKEVEDSKVGKPEKNVEPPYKQLSKDTVDELLRVMARAKFDRSTASLPTIDEMLKAYMGDLSAVGPSLTAYSEATSRLAHLEEARHHQTTPITVSKEETTSNVAGWQDSVRSLFGLVEIKKQPTGNSWQTTTTTTTTSSSAGESDPLAQKRAFEERVLKHERLLRESLTMLCRSTPIRSSRIAHKYYMADATQATLLDSAAISLRTRVNVAEPAVLEKIRRRHAKERKEDNVTEIELVKRLIDIGKPKKSEVLKLSLRESSQQRFDGDEVEADRAHALLREKALARAKDQAGKWDSQLALAIMEAVGIDDAEVQVEETTRDLRLVRRHAIGLRENVVRCHEALDILKSAILYGLTEETMSAVDESKAKPIGECRDEFVESCTRLFSGKISETATKRRKSVSPSISILTNARVPTDDPSGWLSSSKKSKQGNNWSKVKCGSFMKQYFDSRDAGISVFFEKMEHLLYDYKVRVENIESFVYMQCVGIQLEKHFSKKRAETLAAFEKKTDIQTAINIAQKKRLPLLVQELQTKMALAGGGVTHTTLKESKEAHLWSKSLKQELGDLALRRFQRAKESAMDKIVEVMTYWASYEEVSTSKELKALNKAADEVEKSLKFVDLSSDGISDFLDGSERTSRSRGVQEL